MISKDWTDEERLKILLLLGGTIQEDIGAGVYGAVLDSNAMPKRGSNFGNVRFRPNMQSMIEVILRPAEDLEEQRASIEEMAIARLARMDHDPEEFFRTPLAEARKMIFGTCPECGVHHGPNQPDTH